MSDLKLRSYIETFDGSFWLQSEVSILFNVIHLTLLSYYLFYELLVWLISKTGYPTLPTIIYLDKCSDIVGKNFTLALKMVAVLGATLGMLGSANLKMGFIISNILICAPLVVYDVYLDYFQQIDQKKSLLLQILLSSTFKLFRILSLIVNIMLLIHFTSGKPDGISAGMIMV